MTVPIVKECPHIEKDVKEIYELEDKNKVISILGWERYKLRKNDHCCERMFNYLKKKSCWIVFVPYDRTYAIPYVSLSYKKQLIRLRSKKEYKGEMQEMHFCPFCGVHLLNDDIRKKRHQLMTNFYKKNNEKNESWWDFWSRNRHKKIGKLFFSMKWRVSGGVL